MKQGPMIVLETTATKISNRRYNGYCVAFAPPLYQEWICRCMAGAKSRRIMIFWFNMDREIIAAVSENFPHPGWRGKLHASAEGAKERTGRCKPSYALTDFGASPVLYPAAYTTHRAGLFRFGWWDRKEGAATSPALAKPAFPV